MASSTYADKPIASTQSLQLDLPPSCVEFCPAFPSYFLVGTYNLQKNEDGAPEDEEVVEPKIAGPVKTQSRNGSVIAFCVMDKTLVHLQTEPQPSAILDLHFNPNPGWQEFCAVVSSTATLAMFKFSPDEDQPLKHLRTMDMTALTRGEYEPSPGTELLFLSFCWHPSRADTAAISTSAGNVHLINLGNIGEDWVLHPEPVLTHSLEAWCVAISPSLVPPQQPVGSGFTVFSGGDDSVLRYRACSFAAASETPPAGYVLHGFTPIIKTGHNAGVTAILPLGLEAGDSEFVVTGSYDDHIRLFSIASASAAYGPRTKKLMAESNLGGGVWRLKLIDLRRGSAGDTAWRATILASCMHAGVRIVDLLKTANDDFEFRVIGSFEEHKSMNYGSDYQADQKCDLSVVSTSFYDKLLCLWEFRMT